MTLQAALRLTEILLAAALIQQSLEHLLQRRSGFSREKWVFGIRIALCVLLIADIAPPWPLISLALISLVILEMFHGPYNGGSDRMGLLALWCVTAANLLPGQTLKELAFGYLGIQLLLSYFISGLVKILNPQWRSGRALRDVFEFSTYPVTENLRTLATANRVMFVASWAAMLFELAFPLVLLNHKLLIGALVIAAAFHLANACLFGLNRFFWTWLAAYPALLWLQARISQS